MAFVREHTLVVKCLPTFVYSVRKSLGLLSVYQLYIRYDRLVEKLLPQSAPPALVNMDTVSARVWPLYSLSTLNVKRVSLAERVKTSAFDVLRVSV